jgi:hypothetical protein
MAIDISHSEYADSIDSAEKLHISRSNVPVARTYDPEPFRERRALSTSNFDLATVPPQGDYSSSDGGDSSESATFDGSDDDHHHEAHDDLDHDCA